MIDYIDPVPPVLKFLKLYMAAEVAGGVTIVGGMFEADERGPALSVKLAGGAPDIGEPYSRIQFLARSDSDVQSLNLVIKACNTIARYFDHIQGLRVKSVRIETRPIDTRDADTNLPESWCYVVIEHMEA
ncbi:hypothetical protein [Staphylococcus aureus]|uniref:hypothetical protein n=1 Tax=Staphylococcus aureus TaxID=1280 RepID=UPI0020BE64FD|nr:hypothetical protein [Staphylococcus aureus]